VNDALLVLQASIPEALKKAKPGTKEFRAALLEAIENAGEIAASQGVYNFSKTDHQGLDTRARVLLTVKDGKFELVNFGLTN
jgi:branched-chain amino acid transport system substrate-binding protein